MIAYIDSSVLVRILLGQEQQLNEWARIEQGVTSELTLVECSRTLDRLFHADRLTADEVQEKYRLLAEIMSRLQFMPLDRRILQRAAQPLPVRIATLDAIQLVTAIEYRNGQSRDEPPLRLATHDVELAEGARAFGFSVLGV